MRGVVGGDADLDPVADHHLDTVLFHSSGKHTPDHDVIITLDFHGAAAQNLGDRTLQLNQIVSAQGTPFLATMPQ